MTRHRDYVSGAIVHSTSVYVFVVLPYPLEGNEATILCDRGTEVVKEVVQTLTRVVRGVLHQVVHEPCPWLDIEAILKQVKQLVGQAVVDSLTIVVDPVTVCSD